MIQTTNTCPSNQGRRRFGPARPHVECVECGRTFTDPDNVGNLPTHDRADLLADRNLVDVREVLPAPTWPTFVAVVASATGGTREVRIDAASESGVRQAFIDGDDAFGELADGDRLAQVRQVCECCEWNIGPACEHRAPVRAPRVLFVGLFANGQAFDCSTRFECYPAIGRDEWAIGPAWAFGDVLEWTGADETDGFERVYDIVTMYLQGRRDDAAAEVAALHKDAVIWCEDEAELHDRYVPTVEDDDDEHLVLDTDPAWHLGA